ncbi:MAG: pyruvate formate lyase-activating protein [Cyanobacteria bacterium SIG29]|nr:pyruvate formate lyase-activating protein [Cyanobacteria bacterium SIG29]
MQKEILGNIHSLESMGTVDGPGIRLVVFLQGCPMRCQYCHNPDTWEYKDNKKISVKNVIEKYYNVKEFLKNGGITVTGGEPLSQIGFVTELFKQAKKENIHTALDTSGILFNPENTTKIDGLLKYTDLVLLDIKHINNEEHIKLTGFPNTNILEFAKYLSAINKPVWIRHVVIPTITYNTVYLKELGRFLAQLNNIKALDLLPYHTMAISKYENLKIEYPLKDVPAPKKEEIMDARFKIFRAYKEAKKLG